MRYLITGGAGFIGSHLADRLLQQGNAVRVLDDFSTGTTHNVSHLLGRAGFDLVQGSVLDESLVEEHMAGCDGVFHLAAAVGVRRIMERPVETLVTNVRGTEVILDLAAQHGTKVLLASTSEVYGKTLENNGHFHALREDDDRTMGSTKKRRWAYACSKALDEFLALAYHDEKQLPVVIVRFFNTVGPRQTGRYGMVIPRFVERALQGDDLVVHGDGEQSRSFTHVRDAVWAIVRLMELEEATGEIFNIGHGREITIKALAQRVIELTGSSSNIVYVPYDEVYGEGFEDMRRRTPDISKLQRMIGFEPRHDIEAILRDVVRDFEARRPQETDHPASSVAEPMDPLVPG